MNEPVAIVGLGAEGLAGLSSRANSLISRATFLAGGRRHLQLVGPTSVETFTITDNVTELVSRLARRGEHERCVVLASGDPLFYGVGRQIGEALGRENVRVETAVSSMQIAFARLGLSWHDATIASIHGRDLKTILLPLLGQPKIGLFTRDGGSPSEVAQFLLDRGLDDYEAAVCENLNAYDESVIEEPLTGLKGRRFADLNVLILLRQSVPNLEPLDDDRFAGPETGPILLTHEDIRALVVRRFRGLGMGPIWDLGAGLGGVSIELARAFSAREVVAVERSGTQLGFLRVNRAKFGAWNVRIIEGEAPDRIMSEEAPAGVFVGGSGGRLNDILDAVVEQLRPGGRLVANFVAFENLSTTLERLRTLRWPLELTQVQISEGRPLAGLTSLVPERAVWIVAATKPLADQ